MDEDLRVREGGARIGMQGRADGHAGGRVWLLTSSHGRSHAGGMRQAAHLRRAASQILSSSSDLLASAADSAGPAAASILSSASDMASSAGALGVGRR